MRVHSFRLVLLTGAAVLGLSSTSRADEVVNGASPWYFGASIGAGFIGDFDVNEADTTDSSTGFKASGFLGRHITDNLRGEVELSYLRSNANCLGKCGSTEFDFSDLAVLGNVWLDLPLDRGWTVYGGGGIGVGHFFIQGDSAADNDAAGWAFTYQAGAGVRLALDDLTTIDLGYRFQGSTVDESALDEAWFIARDVELRAHIVQISLSMNFGVFGP